MQQLLTAIPDVEVFLAIEPEELAARTLLFLRCRFDKNGPRSPEMFHGGNLAGELYPHSSVGPTYPREREMEVRSAFMEAWCYLEAQGLIIPAPDGNGQNGWRIVSRRGRKVKSEADFADLAAARSLPRDLLHPAIAQPVWVSFIRGDYGTAVFQAMRAVEIAVREAAGFPQGDHGVPMIRRAFHKDEGPLTDLTSEVAEREALASLFAGAIGSYKNPHSHRNVPLDDPREAAEIVMLASHVLRIVDARLQTGGRA